MDIYEFSFIVDGFDPLDDDQLTALQDLFDDASTSTIQGVTTLEFAVEADNASDALHTTLRTLTDEFPNITVVRLNRDLVAIPDIAQRTDRTPESIRLLARGKRGPGGFPNHISVLGGGTSIWEWAPVAEWLRTHGIHDEGVELIDTETAALFDAHLAAGCEPAPEPVQSWMPSFTGAPRVMFISRSALHTSFWGADVLSALHAPSSYEVTTGDQTRTDVELEVQ
jgi:hypothetical protein